MIKSISALAMAAATSAATPLVAEPVTLTEIGGTITIRGDLLSFDGKTYSVETGHGVFEVPANRAICDGTGCPDPKDLMTSLYLAGSGTVTAKLIPALAQAYFGNISDTMVQDDGVTGRTYFEATRPDASDVMVTMMHSNSASGLQKLISGDMHAAFTTRSVTALEEAAASERGLPTLRSEEQESVIAYDSLLVVTHPSNPIQAMTEMDIASVFAGNISNWSTFGREPGPINLYLREADSNSRDMLEKVLMAPNRKKLSDTITILPTDADIANAVKNDPNAFALTSLVHREGTRALEIEGVCGIRVPATEFTIKSGEYPLARPVYFYHAKEKSPATEMNGFAEFISSGPAQSHIRDAGFLDTQIVAQPLNMQGLRVTNALMNSETPEEFVGTRSMLRLMSYSDRLSTTIRFDGGSTDLDSEDYEHLEDVAALIRSDAYDGAQFYFMGFSDSVGRADLNQYVALKRAEIVRQALVSRYPELTDRVKAQSVGYGELSPLACNETRPGRVKNRRVEIWVRRPLALAQS